MRTRLRAGNWIRLAVAVVVVLTASSCTATVKESPAILKGMSAGADDLRSLFGDLAAATKTADHESPSAFQKAVDAAKAGKTLESSKAQIDALSGSIHQFVEIVGEAIGFDTKILPAEASKLAAASLIGDGGPEFRAYVDELAAKTLRGVLCNGLRGGIDDATAQQADAAGLDYDPIATADQALHYLQEQLDANVTGYGPFIDLQTLARSAVGTATSWVGSFDAIYTSPTGTIRQANIYYFRVCVLAP
jgi:hypothetical protein